MGDKDTDGVSLLVNSLALNGGTIQATDDSTNATLTHTAMTFATHKVDTEVTLLSNLGRTDASSAITISATESARVTIFVAQNKQVDVNAITLDVRTPSDTLDVTVKLLGESDLYTDYTYTGSVTAAGLRTFTLSEPSGMKFGNVAGSSGSGGGGLGTPLSIEIRGSGVGSIELTAVSNISGSGVAGILSFGPIQLLTPKMRLSGHEGAIPQLIYGDVVSSPPNGAAYAAGDRIDMLFMFSRPVDFPQGLTVPFWLGDGAQHRREARLAVKSFNGDFLVFSYTVQPADTDTNGIYIGANPLGDNAGIAFHAENIPAVPAHIAVAANQLAANQSVNGSGTRRCEELFCSTVLADVKSDRTGFSIRRGPSEIPFVPLGASSAWSFGYGGEEDIVARITFFDATHTVGPNLLELLFEVGFPRSLHARLALSVDGTVFLLSEADEVPGDHSFRWYYPGLTWAAGDEIDVKLIELATASFEEAIYAKTEGDSFDVTVTLDEVFVQTTVTLPITVTANGGAMEADYSGIPENLVFVPGDTAKTFTVTVDDDDVDDDGESLTLSFAEPHIRSGGTNETATITLTDNDDPHVTVSFGAGSYTVSEGGTQSVTVELSADPERTVVIPLTTMNQGGVDATDYSVPASVTFNSGEMSKTITFSATHDTVDDDDESVRLSFGAMPDPRVNPGATYEATITIDDDDDPFVEVQFAQNSYTVPEGGTQVVTVTLSADPERTVDIPLVATAQRGADINDYSVPFRDLRHG